MARIIQFDNQNIDYMANITDKFGVEPLECIRACRLALVDLYDLDNDEIVDILGYLSESYMSIGEYTYAAYELKRSLAFDYTVTDTIKLLVTCLSKINEAENRDTCIEYFHELFQSGGVTEEDEEVYALAYSAFTFPERLMSDDSNLYIVSEQEKKKRLVDEYIGFMVKGEHTKALHSIMNTAKKYPYDVTIKEKLTYAYLFESDYDSAKACARKVMNMVQGSSTAFFVYTGACMEAGVVKFDDEVLQYAMSINAKDTFELQRIVFTFDVIGRGDMARAYLEKSVEYYNTCKYMLMEAYFLSKDKDIKGAISKLRSVYALYGDRSFALDYIQVLERGGHLSIEDIGNVPEYINIKHMQDLLLYIEHANTDRVCDDFIDDPLMMRRLTFAVYSDEFNLVEKTLKKLRVVAYAHHMDYFQDLLLDDELVSEDMKILILRWLLIKMPNDDMTYSCRNKVNDVNFVIREGFDKLPLCIREGYARAYSLACFNTMNFDTALADSLYNVIKIIDGRYEQFSNAKTLAAVIAIGSYAYTSNDNVKMLAKLNSTTLAQFNKYMAELNKNNEIYSEDIQDDRLCAQLSDIMKKFGVIDDIDIVYEENDSDDYDVTKRQKDIIAKTILKLGDFISEDNEDTKDNCKRKSKIINMKGEPIDGQGRALPTAKLNVVIKNTNGKKGKVIHKKVTKHKPLDENNSTDPKGDGDDSDPTDKE